MIYKALDIAYREHSGQVDKGGNPYILHPVRVALNCETEEEKVVALLHDVVEDTEVTIDDLRNMGFCEEVLDAITALSKIKGEDYEQFVKRVAENHLASRVKIQDLKDNMNASRLNGKLHWKMETYQKALAYLENSLQCHKG